MSDTYFSIVVAMTLYKIVSLFVGLACAYMGYRLFLSGVYERAGELKTAWGDKNLELKQAAPGTFFALFGTIIVAVTLFKGLGFSMQPVESDTTRIAAVERSNVINAVGAGVPRTPKAPDRNTPLPPSSQAIRSSSNIELELPRSTFDKLHRMLESKDWNGIHQLASTIADQSRLRSEVRESAEKIAALTGQADQASEMSQTQVSAIDDTVFSFLNMNDDFKYARFLRPREPLTEMSFGRQPQTFIAHGVQMGPEPKVAKLFQPRLNWSWFVENRSWESLHGALGDQLSIAENTGDVAFALQKIRDLADGLENDATVDDDRLKEIENAVEQLVRLEQALDDGNTASP